jgi:pimeloyl-ACP methyl ester carboxylesterase
VPHTYTNGIVTFYEDTGEGPLVVLIHGHSLDLQMWKYQVGPLVDMGYRVLRYDVRGHGRTMVPPTGYTWDNYSQDLAELLDRLNVERPAAEPLAEESVHVVGLSMGGAIALKFTLDHPERVLSLTVADSALPGYSYSPEFASFVQELVKAVQTKGVSAGMEEVWLPHPIFDGLRRQPEKFAEVQAMVRDFQAAEYFPEAATPGYAQPDLPSQLGDIRAPTLVVVGEDDLSDFRLIADLVEENIAGARKVVLAGCGHIPPMEDPAAFNAALLEFLAANRPVNRQRAESE